MNMNKRSFFDRLTGNYSDDAEELGKFERKNKAVAKEDDWMSGDSEEGQLTVDMYQKPNEIVIEAMIAGVKPEDLDISVTKDMITVRGKRQQAREVTEENYYYKELYWGSFSRSILLPQEVDADAAEASTKDGVLIVRLPKIDRDKVQKLKIKHG
ncbi:MAG: Hsp20/alpha crystallin family protein [Candidatus Pacebacteria bacterium]|nr:Hsp20/alpha crystallin family protein [Candidatus Paceibacterota bacterium]